MANIKNISVKLISNLTIQRKLLVIFVGTCLTMLILAGGATIAWSQYTFRQNMVRDLVVQTIILPEFSTRV